MFYSLIGDENDPAETEDRTANIYEFTDDSEHIEN